MRSRSVRKEHAPKSPRKKDDAEFEIAFFERILADAPDFIEALSAIADLYTRSGYWQKGLEADLRLSVLRPDDPIVFYNLACSYALLNQTRASFVALTKAIELGYDDFEFLKSDDDLSNLLKDEAVADFIKHAQKRRRSS